MNSWKVFFFFYFLLCFPQIDKYIGINHAELTVFHQVNIPLKTSFTLRLDMIKYVCVCFHTIINNRNY